MRSAPIRWGLLGAGTVSRQFARSVALLEGHCVRAVASRSAGRAADLARDLGGGVVAHDSYSALVEDQSVDAIHVATPPALHAEHATLALRAGKAVLCEKPFATSAAEAQAMADTARTMGVFCMEAMWMRFIPIVRTLRERIRRGDIGQVRMLHAELGFPIPFDRARRCYDPTPGGGALLDLGIYPLSLAWFLLGRPEEGRALATHAATGVDDQTAIVLSYASGALACLSCSFAQRGRNSAVVAGADGSFTLEAPLYAPSRLVWTRGAPAARAAGRAARGKVARLLESMPSLTAARRSLAPLLRQIVRRERESFSEPFTGFGYQFEAAEVGRCLREGLLESPDMPLDESVEILAAVDALRTSGALRTSHSDHDVRVAHGCLSQQAEKRLRPDPVTQQPTRVVSAHGVDPLDRADVR